jgi:hypothetical protein
MVNMYIQKTNSESIPSMDVNYLMDEPLRGDSWITSRFDTNVEGIILLNGNPYSRYTERLKPIIHEKETGVQMYLCDGKYYTRDRKDKTKFNFYKDK